MLIAGVGGESILYRFVEIIEYAWMMVGFFTNDCKDPYYKTCT